MVPADIVNDFALAESRLENALDMQLINAEYLLQILLIDRSPEGPKQHTAVVLDEPLQCSSHYAASAAVIESGEQCQIRLHEAAWVTPAA
jgi:hypothetical protein